MKSFDSVSNDREAKALMIERGGSGLYVKSDLGRARRLTLAVIGAGGRARSAAAAAALGVSPKGGFFKNMRAAAIGFGLLTADRGDLDVTDLGREVCFDIPSASALTSTIDAVPLFAELRARLGLGEEITTSTVEDELAAIGVSDEHRAEVRKEYLRSAEVVRLLLAPKSQILPIAPGDAPAGDVVPEGDGDAGSATEANLAEDPFMRDLLRRPPPRGIGWTMERRENYIGLIGAYVREVLSEAR